MTLECTTHALAAGSPVAEFMPPGGRQCKRSTKPESLARDKKCRSVAKPARCTPRRSTKLLRLWRQAAVSVQHQNAERDQLWERLAKKLQPILVAKLRRNCRENSADFLDLEEVVQEVFLRLLKGEGRVMRRCKAVNDFQLQSYLNRVCDTCLADLIRFRQAGKRGFKDTVPYNGCYEQWVPDYSQDLERTMICRSELAGFFRAIRRCARRSAQHGGRNSWIFEEVFVQGRGSRELALQLGLCASTVDSVVSRMRRDLRAKGWNVAPRIAREVS